MFFNSCSLHVADSVEPMIILCILSFQRTSRSIPASCSDGPNHNHKSKKIEHVQFVSTLSKGRNFTINSFDIVAVFGNKVECCFDVVSGVDGA